VITNPKVNRRLRALAAERSIPHQVEVLPAGGTDTGELQRSGGATAAAAVSIPTRYLHTAVESVHGRDLTAAIDLTTAFLATETGDADYAL
jgi:endoglucanase